MNISAIVLLLMSPITVVPTGDSNTSGYAPNRIQQAFDAGTVAANVSAHAEGGLDTQEYLDDGFASLVIADNPDAILYMMGTNDAFSHVESPFSLTATTYRIETVVDAFSGRSLVIGSLLPVLNRPTENANVQAINAWLETKAAGSDAFFLDVNWFIQQEPNWQDWYSDDVHLWENEGAGYVWLASLFHDAAIHAISPADGNFDGIVDLGDFTRWGADFGTPVPNFRTSDFNADGLVDLGDFTFWGEHFGTTIATPEPSGQQMAGIVLTLVGLYFVIDAFIRRGSRK